MATISENLQILKDSTDAIKQAIIDKGGEISGDISTWANAISGISGGGSAEEEITFTGTMSYSGSNITLSGLLSSKPELSPIFLVLVYLGTGVAASKTFVSDVSNTLSVTINAGEPLIGTEIPGICLMHQGSRKIFPVTFIQQTPIKFYVNDIEYDALYPMTWEQFVNSETYNPTLTDIAGHNYKQFTVKNGCPAHASLYDGEYDIDDGIFEIDENVPKSPTTTDIIKINGNYMC